MSLEKMLDNFFPWCYDAASSNIVTSLSGRSKAWHDRGIPRYLWVYNSLKNQIEVEDFKVGDFLPPEPELQKTFHVSRTTVRKAVEMLAQQGFVYIRQGKGTQVIDFKATQKLGFVTSFSETLREKGATVTQEQIRVDLVPAPRRIAAGPPGRARRAPGQHRARDARQRDARLRS